VLPEGFQETELYRICVESGIIPGAARDPGAGPTPPRADLPPLDLTYRVGGMWCPSCAWLLEEVLGRMPGVILAKVDFVSDILTLKYLPHLVSPAEIVSRAQRLGYRLGTFQTSGVSEGKGLILRLGITAILTANIMMVSLAVYSGFFREFSGNSLNYFSYPLLVMGTFVLFYGGLPILKRGMAALRYLSPSMDTLIALGALSAYLYSTMQVVRGGLHLYFDTASMLITFVLFGRYVEIRARERVSAGIGGLRRVACGKVRIDEDGREGWTGADTMRPGDLFRALGGDAIPLDSRVVGGVGLIDQSFLTGESRPRVLSPGDLVAGGSMVREGQLLLETTRIGRESLVGQIVATVEDAIGRKNNHELLAERASRLFVPAVLCLAAATGLVTWLRHVPADAVLLRSLSVLLISCPCALGLAIPLAKVAVIDLARRQGILVRDPGALERLKEVDTIVFDKTGTLTEGNFSLQKVVSAELEESDLFARLAAIEAQAQHFLAREIVREAQKRAVGIDKAEAFESFIGLGVKGRVRGVEVCIGSRPFMEQNRLKMGRDFDDEARVLGEDGKTVVFFGWVGHVRGFLAFGDPLRPGARELADALRNRGVDVWLVSGDSDATTRAVARRLGIGRVLARALPEDKVELIKDLRDQGLSVAMIGDGFNDAGALAESDVGGAFGAGVDLIREASDLTFLSPEPGRLLDAMALSFLAARTIRQNLFFASLYNLIAIPVAASGLLNPLMAVIAMFASSLTVTANTLRIFRRDAVPRSISRESGPLIAPSAG
jgi:heavy metal translocating P-type ATPase